MVTVATALSTLVKYDTGFFLCTFNDFNSTNRLYVFAWVCETAHDREAINCSCVISLSNLRRLISVIDRVVFRNTSGNLQITGVFDIWGIIRNYFCKNSAQSYFNRCYRDWIVREISFAIPIQWNFNCIM